MGDLQYASPATVSRAGMVYVDPRNLGYLPYWQRWVANRPDEEERNTFDILFHRYVPNTLRYIFEGTKGSVEVEPLVLTVPQTALNLVSCFYQITYFIARCWHLSQSSLFQVTQLCFMLDALLPMPHPDDDEEIPHIELVDLGTGEEEDEIEQPPTPGPPPPPPDPRLPPGHIPEEEAAEAVSEEEGEDPAIALERMARVELLECVFLQALYFSLGGPLDAASRKPFDEFVKQIAGIVSFNDSPENPASTRMFAYHLIIFLL